MANPKCSLSIDSGGDTEALAILNGDKAEDETITVRESKYLNNLIEQDYRNIKRRICLMLGFESFRRAQTILAGRYWGLHMIRKGQLQRLSGGIYQRRNSFICWLPK